LERFRIYILFVPKYLVLRTNVGGEIRAAKTELRGRGRRGCGFVGYIFGVIFLKSQEEVQIASTFVE